MRKIQHMLRQAGSLDDTPNLDGALFLDELADGVQQVRRELFPLVSTCPSLSRNQQRKHTSEYHRYCHVTSLINAPHTSLTFALLPSSSFSTPLIAFGLNFICRQFSYASTASSSWCSLSASSPKIPFFGRLLVQQLLRTELCHLGAPYRVHAQVLVEHHEEVVEPALAKPLVVEVCVILLVGI
jgi:hypothetical protein